MYAVVATGGKQYRVSEGDTLFVEKLVGEAGETLDLEVLAVSDENGMHVGDALSNAKVSANIVKHGRGKKLVIFKYKPKKGFRKRKGHRQAYTKIEIQSIAL